MSSIKFDGKVVIVTGAGGGIVFKFIFVKYTEYCYF